MKVEFKNSGFSVGVICTVIHRDRFDDFKTAAKESQFQGFTGFGGGTYGYATSYQTAVRVLSLAVIVNAVLMYTGDIVAIQVSQCHKNRGEHARFGFKPLSSRLALCGRRKLTAAIQLFTILHRSQGRRSLLLAILIFTIAEIGESRLSSQHALCVGAGT